MGTAERGIPRAVAIAWGVHEAPQRGPSRALSHEEIVAAGIRIADADGLAAVTMSRVAQAVGFTTMSLYRYVADKDELLELMRDAASALPDARLPTTWRPALRAWALLLRDIYRAHPWILQIPRRSSALLMPHAMAIADLGLQALRGLRIDEEEKVATILSVTMLTGAMVGLERDLAAEPSPQLGPEAYAVLGAVMTPERLPALAPMMLAGDYVGGPPGTEGVDTEFEFGLERILDGLELLHRRRRPRADRR